MKRLLVLIAAVAVVLGLTVGSAGAGEGYPSFSGPSHITYHVYNYVNEWYYPVTVAEYWAISYPSDVTNVQVVMVTSDGSYWYGQPYYFDPYDPPTIVVAGNQWTYPVYSCLRVEYDWSWWTTWQCV